MTSGKAAERERLWARYDSLWPGMVQENRPPQFPGQNQAAERLRRTQAWRLARCVAVLPDPVLLQVRINALQDGKQLMAVTPGLKQGFVRIDSGAVPVALRKQSLGGHAMAKAGKRLLFPEAKPGKAGLMVVPALALDENGLVLGDGRGIADLAYALLRELDAMSGSTPVAALLAQEQMGHEFPGQAWDVSADLAITPQNIIKFQVKHTRPGLEALPKAMASMPVVRGIKQLLTS